MSVEIIAELDDPRLEPFRNLKATNRTRWANQFVAEGRWSCSACWPVASR